MLKWLKTLAGYLAKSGLIFRGDPPKVIDVAAREWGAESGGLALSITSAHLAEPGQRLALSVVLLNKTAMPRDFAVPGWLPFFRIEIQSPGGGRIGPSAYGLQALKFGGAGPKVDVHLEPGQPFEVELPIGLLFDLKAPGEYRVRLSCPVPGDPTGIIESNECVVKR